MHGSTAREANYGNWVSRRFVLVPGVLTLLFGSLALFLPGFFVVAAVLLLCCAYFAYARHVFSPKGGDIQARVQELVLDHLRDWDGTGKVLDIGCGNGPLTIRLARKFPQAVVTGVDCWGSAWEYSKAICDRNAAMEGVADRVTFRRADASSLPFDDGAFEVAVSNLVFHEVRDVKDKRVLVKEALRMVKKGGWFVFQDLFLWEQVYGETEALLETVKGWGMESVGLVDTSDSGFIPRALKLPFMLGTVGILFGRK